MQIKLANYVATYLLVERYAEDTVLSRNRVASCMQNSTTCMHLACFGHCQLPGC